MKRIILLVALAVAWPAWAQAPAQKEAGQKEAAQPAPAAKFAGVKKAVAKKSRRSQDARHCLQRGDNNAIIKCAEEFL
jgi:hypothetical protein